MFFFSKKKRKTETTNNTTQFPTILYSAAGQSEILDEAFKTQSESSAKGTEKDRWEENLTPLK